MIRTAMALVAAVAKDAPQANRRHDRCRQPQDQGYKNLRHAIGEPHINVAALPAHIQQPRQIRHQGVFHPGGGVGDYGRTDIDRAGIDAGTCSRDMGAALSRHQESSRSAAALSPASHRRQSVRPSPAKADRQA